MRKYFGTDGIRGIANTELTPELAYKVARASAYVFEKYSANDIPLILIGKDTRVSGSLIEESMTQGFLSYGVNVIHLGVIPTPAVAYLTRRLNADASVVISASHNSYEYNGIKFFSNKGMKIDDKLEEEIEEAMNSEIIKETRAYCEKTCKNESKLEIIEEYKKFFVDTFCEDVKKFPYKDLKIGIDTANGATYKIAEEVFKALRNKLYDYRK